MDSMVTALCAVCGRDNDGQRTRAARFAYVVVTTIAWLIVVPLSHAEERAEPDGSDYSGNLVYLTPLTITGTARNQNNEPVANADVIVGHPSGFSIGFNRPDGTRHSVDAVYGRGKTNEDGTYAIDIRLPVIHLKAMPVPKPAQGSFRIVSMAEGYGFTWTGARHYRPGSRPENLPREEAAGALYEDEPLSLDLQFKPEVRLHGVMVDDAGSPLAGARLQVGLVNTSRDTVGHAPGMANFGLLNVKRPDASLSMGVQLIPERFRATRTDENGEFELKGLPRDASMLAFADYRFEYLPQEFSLVTAKGQNARNRFYVGHEGELNLRFERPQVVRVQIVQADTRKPAQGVTVRVQAVKGARPGYQRAGSRSVTGADGIATLSLPPSEYLLIVEPPSTAPYAAFRRRVSIERSPVPIEIGYPIGRGTEVTFKTVDVESGKPVPGIGFWYETDTTVDLREVHSQTAIVDHPRTGQDGQFSAILKPGRYQFEPRLIPKGYELVEGTDQLIDLPAEKHATLEFRFRRTGDAPLTASSIPTRTREDLKSLSNELHAKWNRQRALTSSARYRVVRNNFLRTNLSFREVKTAVEALDGKTRSEIVANLKRLFPNLGTNEMLYLTDGRRVAYASISRRDEPAWRWQGEPVHNISTFNGFEQLSYSWVNRQLDIYDRAKSSLYLTRLDDLLFWPRALLFRGSEKDVVIERNDGRIRIAGQGTAGGSEQTSEMVVDAATGFVFRNSSTFRNRGRHQWQFLPREIAGGAIVPGVYLSIRQSGEKVSRAELTMIRQVQLVKSIPPETFTIPAPAGTMMLDYRNVDPKAARRRPSFIMVPHEVVDAVALADEAPKRNPAPALQRQQNIPPVHAVSWLDEKGKTEAPTWQGRLTLMLFLRTDTRSGVRNLAELRRAVKHFAETEELLIIGMHTAGAGPEFVSAWLDRNDIPMKVGVDEVSRENRLGKTAHAWHVRSVPEAFLFDVQGKLIQQGQIDWCLSTVGRMLEQRKKQKEQKAKKAD